MTVTNLYEIRRMELETELFTDISRVLDEIERVSPDFGYLEIPQ